MQIRLSQDLQEKHDKMLMQIMLDKSIPSEILKDLTNRERHLLIEKVREEIVYYETLLRKTFSKESLAEKENLGNHYQGFIALVDLLINEEYKKLTKQNVTNASSEKTTTQEN